MRDPKRIEVILQEISNIWHKYPDLRLGQLIGNVLEGASLYYVEDDGLVNALKDMYEDAKEKVQFSIESQIWDLVKKHPDELGFVLQAKTYDEYVKSYTDIGSSISDVAYTVDEFNSLKLYFKDFN